MLVFTDAAGPGFVNTGAIVIVRAFERPNPNEADSASPRFRTSGPVEDDGATPERWPHTEAWNPGRPACQTAVMSGTRADPTRANDYPTRWANATLRNALTRSTYSLGSCLFNDDLPTVNERAVCHDRENFFVVTPGCHGSMPSGAHANDRNRLENAFAHPGNRISNVIRLQTPSAINAATGCVSEIDQQDGESVAPELRRQLQSRSSIRCPRIRRRFETVHDYHCSDWLS